MASFQLVSMHQLAEARRDDDNWTGMSDQKERRKRQTRLALRAYRKRKAIQRESLSENRPRSILRFRVEPAPQTTTRIGHKGQYIGLPASVPFIPSFRSHNGHIVPSRYLYPISSDHLLPLIEYNVYRASTTNLQILGYLHLMDTNCAFRGSVVAFPNPYQGESIPDSLRLTSLQQSTPHPDWIDLLPSPRMRDNAIRTQHQFTNRELCADILGGMMGRQNTVDCGLIVWSNPWEASGWELTEGFVRKWGFLLEGCSDMFQSTNRWRHLRGEEPMPWPSE